MTHIRHFLKLNNRKLEFEDRLMEDLIIEEEVEQCGFSFDQSPEDRMLFSLSCDFTPQQFMGIIINSELI